MPQHQRKCGKTGIVSRADAELSRHIKALGLEGVDAYRAWCRAHGFDTALNKSWQIRRAEQQAQERAEAEKAAAAEMERHIAALGLGGADEYARWRRTHDLPATPGRSAHERRQEQSVREREKAEAALEQARRLARRPEDVLRRLHSGTTRREEMKSPALLHLHSVFASIGREETDARGAFLRLLLHAQGRGANALLSGDAVIPTLGGELGNTFPEGLLALARHHEGWIRPPEDWRPDSHNPHRQFGALARHLLARYFVPAFLEAAWFRGNGERARRQQGWFRHIGMGGNIRTADIPLSLTKMAAHRFLQAPSQFSIEAAFRWGQILALGGDEPLVRAVIGTRLGETLEHEDFWVSALHFFVNNPLLDTAYVGAIVDYIHHRKYVAEAVVDESGAVREAIPDPDFSMKGRTAPALCRLVDGWHRELARNARAPALAWEPSGIAPYRHAERSKDADRPPTLWTIHEILSSRELTEEGREMRHCVASYARSCARGQVSIWSLQAAEGEHGPPRRVMTIAVDNLRRTITQARGRCNKAPGERRAGVRLQNAPDRMRHWAARERLSVPGYV